MLYNLSQVPNVKIIPKPENEKEKKKEGWIVSSSKIASISCNSFAICLCGNLMIITGRSVIVQINKSLWSSSSKVAIQDVKMDCITACQLYFLKENFMGMEYSKKWVLGKNLRFFF